MPKVNLGRNEAGEALTTLLWGRKAVTGMPAEEMAAIAADVRAMIGSAAAPLRLDGPKDGR